MNKSRKNQSVKVQRYKNLMEQNTLVIHTAKHLEHGRLRRLTGLDKEWQGFCLHTRRLEEDPGCWCL